MSFGPSAQTKQAFSTLGDVGTQAKANSGTAFQQGNNLIGMGSGIASRGAAAMQPAANLFSGLLGGNAAEASRFLAPTIESARGQTQQTLQSLSNLQPRGGGRSGSLFDISYAPQRQAGQLYNQARIAGATALPQIGSAMSSAGSTIANSGTNLFNAGNTALSTAGQSASNLGQLGLQQQQMSNSLWGGLGKGLLGLATLPFGGGALSGTLLGSLGGLFGGGKGSSSIGPSNLNWGGYS